MSSWTFRRVSSLRLSTFSFFFNNLGFHKYWFCTRSIQFLLCVPFEDSMNWPRTFVLFHFALKNIISFNMNMTSPTISEFFRNYKTQNKAAITKQYRKLALKYHPNKVKGNSGAKFQELQQVCSSLLAFNKPTTGFIFRPTFYFNIQHKPIQKMNDNKSYNFQVITEQGITYHVFYERKSNNHKLQTNIRKSASKHANQQASKHASTQASNTPKQTFQSRLSRQRALGLRNDHFRKLSSTTWFRVKDILSPST